MIIKFSSMKSSTGSISIGIEPSPIISGNNFIKSAQNFEAGLKSVPLFFYFFKQKVCYRGVFLLGGVSCGILVLLFDLNPCVSDWSLDAGVFRSSISLSSPYKSIRMGFAPG